MSPYRIDSMKKAVAKLLVRIQDGSKRDRLDAFFALMRMGRNARSAVPTLIALTKSKVPYIRASAASCLGCVAAPSRLIERQLLRLMQDRYIGIRYYAANSIHQLDLQSTAILKQFLLAIRLRDRELRLVAAGVLSEYGERANPAKGLLLRRLRDKDWATRITSASALASIGPKDHRVKLAIERQLARDPEAHMPPRYLNVLLYMELRQTFK